MIPIYVITFDYPNELDYGNLYGVWDSYQDAEYELYELVEGGRLSRGAVAKLQVMRGTDRTVMIEETINTIR